MEERIELSEADFTRVWSLAVPLIAAGNDIDGAFFKAILMYRGFKSRLANGLLESSNGFVSSLEKRDGYEWIVFIKAPE